MSINEYLVCVLAAACIGILSDIVTSNYSKNTKGIEKYVKLAVSLCILACVFSPVIGTLDEEILSDMFSFNNPQSDVVDTNESLYMLEKECEDKVSSYIFEKTSIKPIYVSIDIELKEESTELVIKSAKIKISKDYKENSEEIKNAAFEALEMDVIIEYEE